MVLVKPTDLKDTNGISYTEVKCGTTNGENTCTIPLKDGKAQPTVLLINSKTKDTFIKSSLDNVKIDLSALKNIGKISAIYTVASETLVYVKHAGGTHTLHIEGHKALTKDLFKDSDSKDLIDGLVTTKDTTDYYNLLCGNHIAQNKCVPVTIDGVDKPTGYLLQPAPGSTQTHIYNSASEPFFFNLQNLVKDYNVNPSDKIDARFDNKVEFYHNDKVIHTATIENDFAGDMPGLLNTDSTYVY